LASKKQWIVKNVISTIELEFWGPQEGGFLVSLMFQ
jgi:hypothetical protein